MADQPARNPEEKPSEAEQATDAAIDGLQSALDTREWLPEFVRPYWETMQDQPWILAAIVIVLGFIVGKVIQFVFTRFLNQISKRTKSDFDDRLLALLSKPIFTIIFILSLTLATAALQLSDGVTLTVNSILFTILAFKVIGTGFKAIRLLLDAFSGPDSRFKLLDERTIPLFDIVLKVLLFAFGTYFILLIWGVNLTAWLASAGIVGIALGFAAKDTLANLFSGFFILADGPYKLGDFVVLDSGERGRVTHVGIRSSRILTNDDIEVTIPNAVIGNAKIVNESGGPWLKQRLRIQVGVAYGSDLEHVCEVLEQIANDEEKISKQPTPRVRMRAFGASSLDFELLCWINDPVQRGLVAHNLYMTIYKRFNELGIEIPYAKRDLYIKEMPGMAEEEDSKD